MPDRHGPLRTNRFKVELDSIEITGFNRVDIPSQETQQVEYREGEDASHQKKLWGQTTYEDLTLERGVKKDDTRLFDWRKQVVEGQMEEARKNIAVILQDEQGEQQIRWEFTNAWPKRYEPPTMESSGQGGQANIATETIVVTYDEMKRTQ